jgi:predicted nucleic acid-binding protein
LTGKPVYVIDSHILGAYLLDELPDRSNRIFEDAEEENATLIIPSIVIAELIYVYEKAKLVSKIWEMFEKLDVYPSFTINPLDEPLLKIIPDIKLAELHDRIIVATCIYTKAKALLTKDEEIRSSKLVRTIY